MSLMSKQKTYSCMNILYDSFNMCNTELVFYEVIAEDGLSLEDSPLCQYYNKNHSMDDKILSIPEAIRSKIKGHRVYLVPKHLKSYLTRSEGNSTFDRNFFKFFSCLEEDLKENLLPNIEQFNKLTLGNFKENLTLVDRLSKIKFNVIYRYKRVFVYLFAMHDSLGYPLLNESIENNNLEEIFEIYWSNYNKTVNTYTNKSLKTKKFKKDNNNKILNILKNTYHIVQQDYRAETSEYNLGRVGLLQNLLDKILNEK